MYASNVLKLESEQKFKEFLNIYGIDRVRQIVDSYDSLSRNYGKGREEEARSQMKNYFKINDEILDGAINHVTLQNGGRVISVDEQNTQKRHLEDRLRFSQRANNHHVSTSSQNYSENAGSKVIYLDGRRKADVNSDVSVNTTYNKNAIVTPNWQNIETAADNSYAKPVYIHSGKARKFAKRVAVGAVMLGTLLNPFVKIDNGYAREQPKPARLIEALQEGDADKKVEYYQRTDEISQVGKGEKKYQDSSEEARIWYGLPKKRPEVSFKHEGDSYTMHVKIGINKNLQGLDGLLGSVKVGGTWYSGIDTKEGTDFDLDKSTYNSLKGKIASQATLYRDVKVDEKDVRQIGGSWKYEKPSTKVTHKPKREKKIERAEVKQQISPNIGIPWNPNYHATPTKERQAKIRYNIESRLQGSQVVGVNWNPSYHRM